MTLPIARSENGWVRVLESIRTSSPWGRAEIVSASPSQAGIPLKGKHDLEYMTNIAR
jgi:hypothetical protein